MEVKSSLSPSTKGNCFLYNSPGHWKDSSPSRPQNKKQQSQVPDFVFPSRMCPCNGGPCVVKTSFTDANPNRAFYKCLKCGQFKWCDDLLRSAIKNLENRQCPCGAGWCFRQMRESGEDAGAEYFVCPYRKNPCSYIVRAVQYGFPQTYPMCPCRAGRSRLYIESGRLYFGCTILKGQGACNFIKWCDASETNHEPVTGSNFWENDCKPVAQFNSPANGHRLETGPSSSENGHKLVNGLNSSQNADTSVIVDDQYEWDDSTSHFTEATAEVTTLDGDDAEICDILSSILDSELPTYPSVSSFERTEDSGHQIMLRPPLPVPSDIEV